MYKKYIFSYQSILLVLSILLNAYLFIQFGKLEAAFVQSKTEVILLEQSPIIEQGLTTESGVYFKEEIEVIELTEREKIDIYVSEISEMYSIDKYLIHSIIYYESSYISKSINSSSGCTGLMQVCPKWHKKRAERLGVTDFSDPYGSILLGVDYISELLEKHKDIKLVLMLYSGTHKHAFEMYNNGQISNYTKKVLNRANELRLRV